MLGSQKPQTDLRQALPPAAIVSPYDYSAIGTRPHIRRFAPHLILSADTLTDALAVTFPVVARIVGSSSFASLVEDFALRSMQRSAHTLRPGSAFPSYLSSVPALAGAAYLPDIARLELAVDETMHAGSETRLSPAALMQVHDAHIPRLIFSVSPATRTVASRYPIDRIWRAGDMSPRMVRRLTSDKSAVRLLIRRRAGKELIIRRMSKAEFTFLRALRAGRPLGEAEEYARSADEKFNPGRLLLQFINTGVLGDFTIGSALATG